MAKRNQYNRPALAAQTSCRWPTIMANQTSFLGALDFPFTRTIATGEINNGSNIGITQNGVDHGTLVFTDVDMGPGDQFTCSISNSDWSGVVLHSVFTQLLHTNSGHCYANVVVLPATGVCQLRVVSHTATLSHESVTLMYWIIRSDFV